MSGLTSAERAVVIVNSGRKSNRPISENERVVGFVVNEDIAGLSDGLFALDHIAKAVNSHDALVAALTDTLSWLTSYPGGGAKNAYDRAVTTLASVQS